MNKSFFRKLMTRTQFPEDAVNDLSKLLDSLDPAALDAVVKFYVDNGYSLEPTQPYVDSFSQDAGIHPYTTWLIVLMLASESARPAFRSDEVYWDTLSDLRCKALECKEVHGVWGTFVAYWYTRIFTGDIIKLGRLEYENITYPYDHPFTSNGITVNKGDPIKNIHIPFSGEPFTLDARMDSYRRAYAYFADELNGKPLVCICKSWLLYPGYRDILPTGSNIRSFMDDFYIHFSKDSKSFDVGWRVFGRHWGEPFEQLPENTGLQRAFKNHLLSGGKTGSGHGYFAFDGEKLYNSPTE